jgi:hypothetical protein
MTPDEAFAIVYAEGLKRPLTQAQADRIAALLAPYWPAAQPQAA